MVIATLCSILVLIQLGFCTETDYAVSLKHSPKKCILGEAASNQDLNFLIGMQFEFTIKISIISELKSEKSALFA